MGANTGVIELAFDQDASVLGTWLTECSTVNGETWCPEEWASARIIKSGTSGKLELVFGDQVETTDVTFPSTSAFTSYRLELKQVESSTSSAGLGTE